MLLHPSIKQSVVVYPASLICLPPHYAPLNLPASPTFGRTQRVLMSVSRKSTAEESTEASKVWPEVGTLPLSGGLQSGRCDAQTRLWPCHLLTFLNEPWDPSEDPVTSAALLQKCFCILCHPPSCPGAPNGLSRQTAELLSMAPSPTPSQGDCWLKGCRVGKWAGGNGSRGHKTRAQEHETAHG